MVFVIVQLLTPNITNKSPMTDCNPPITRFSRCQTRLVQADFSGGDITSNAGVLLLRQIDRKTGLTRTFVYKELFHTISRKLVPG